MHWISTEFFKTTCLQNILSKLYSDTQKILNFVQENVKNCRLISHFASASPGIRLPNPLLELCPKSRPHSGTSVPQARPQPREPPPLQNPGYAYARHRHIPWPIYKKTPSVCTVSNVYIRHKLCGNKHDWQASKKARVFLAQIFDF